MRLALTCRALAERELREQKGKWFPYLHAIRYSSADGLTSAVEYVTFWRIDRLHAQQQRWHLLEQLVNVFWFDNLMGIVATTTGYYDAASTLPQLHKMETFLEVIEEQRARHLSRHPELDVNAIFCEYDMQEIYGTWRDDHTSWMNAEKLRAY